ncbi:MAG: zinc metallopeptidase [Clostridiales bacterium]|nr:zinc metallopeptidase [Candidatus Crickella equi]
MYYFDWTYVVLVMPAFLFSLWASAQVKSAFARYSRVRNSRGITGAQAAQALLEAHGINDVSIQQTGGQLSDFYDPSKKLVKLSVYNDTSVAAVGVACHEIGHAIQHAENYFPVKLRAAIVPITNFGSRLSIPLILLGIIMSYSAYYWYNLVYLGIALFGLCVVFQLVTLPVEFNASRRALQGIQELGLLAPEEEKGARKVLRAAALTYVAALAISLAQLLRLLLIFGGGRRD